MEEIKRIGGLQGSIQETLRQATSPSGSFEQAIKEAIKEVSEVQSEAEKAIENFSTGDVKDIHTVVLAMEKADMSFQTLMAVRNKLLSAYEEIMRTPV
jgi:flagellar hook-basal body complex protein FliE